MKGFKPEETLMEYDFGHGHKELYAGQPKTPGRQKEASDWFRVNPHRLHLGMIGFDFDRKDGMKDITAVDQHLDLWTGTLDSKFKYKGAEVKVKTVCHHRKTWLQQRLCQRSAPEYASASLTLRAAL